MRPISTIYHKCYHYTYTLRRRLASIYRDNIFTQLYLEEKTLCLLPGPDSYREAKTSPTATPTATQLYHRAVRLSKNLDLFVDSLSIKDYGFRTDFTENGRPAYHPSDLLKLFIYGYMNKVRSSRDLEKECKRNIEVMWLLKCLKPDHNTISNFRRDNPKAIKKVFRATVQIAKHFDLIGGKLIAGDSTKLRAQNSKKNNYNQAKIDRHVAYIDNKLEEYTQGTG